MKLIEAAWNTYSEKVIPWQAPPIQRQEMRRAFYSGASGVLVELLRVMSPGKEPTESDLAIMDGIQEELDQFCRDLEAGKA